MILARATGDDRLIIPFTDTAKEPEPLDDEREPVQLYLSFQTFANSIPEEDLTIYVKEFAYEALSDETIDASIDNMFRHEGVIVLDSYYTLLFLDTKTIPKDCAIDQDSICIWPHNTVWYVAIIIPTKLTIDVISIGTCDAQHVESLCTNIATKTQFQSDKWTATLRIEVTSDTVDEKLRSSFALALAERCALRSSYLTLSYTDMIVYRTRAMYKPIIEAHDEHLGKLTLKDLTKQNYPFIVTPADTDFYEPDENFPELENVGLKVIDVYGDGNCGYYAFLIGLENAGILDYKAKPPKEKQRRPPWKDSLIKLRQTLAERSEILLKQDVIGANETEQWIIQVCEEPQEDLAKSLYAEGKPPSFFFNKLKADYHMDAVWGTVVLTALHHVRVVIYLKYLDFNPATKARAIQWTTNIYTSTPSIDSNTPPKIKNVLMEGIHRLTMTEYEEMPTFEILQQAGYLPDDLQHYQYVQRIYHHQLVDTSPINEEPILLGSLSTALSTERWIPRDPTSTEAQIITDHVTTDGESQTLELLAKAIEQQSNAESDVVAPFPELPEKSPDIQNTATLEAANDTEANNTVDTDNTKATADPKDKVETVVPTSSPASKTFHPSSEQPEKAPGSSNKTSATVDPEDSAATNVPANATSEKTTVVSTAAPADKDVEQPKKPPDSLGTIIVAADPKDIAGQEDMAAATALPNAPAENTMVIAERPTGEAITVPDTQTPTPEAETASGTNSALDSTANTKATVSTPDQVDTAVPTTAVDKDAIELHNANIQSRANDEITNGSSTAANTLIEVPAEKTTVADANPTKDLPTSTDTAATEIGSIAKSKDNVEASALTAVRSDKDLAAPQNKDLQTIDATSNTQTAVTTPEAANLIEDNSASGTKATTEPKDIATTTMSTTAPTDESQRAQTLTDTPTTVDDVTLNIPTATEVHTTLPKNTKDTASARTTVASSPVEDPETDTDDQPSISDSSVRSLLAIRNKLRHNASIPGSRQRKATQRQLFEELTTLLCEHPELLCSQIDSKHFEYARFTYNAAANSFYGCKYNIALDLFLPATKIDSDVLPAVFREILQLAPGSYIPRPGGASLTTGKQPPLFSYVRVRYQQCTKHYCITYSLCSALAYCGFPQEATVISKHAQTISQLPYTCAMAQIRHLMESYVPSIGRPVIYGVPTSASRRKKRKVDLDMFLATPTPYPTLVLFFASDGVTLHANCFVDDLIFDAISYHAPFLHRDSLEWIFNGPTYSAIAAYRFCEKVSPKGHSLDHTYSRQVKLHY